MRNIASQPTEDGERVTRETFRDYSMEELAQNLSWPLGSSVWEHAGRVPSLFDAVQQQLGLKLRETRVPTEVLVVDHADRTPTGN